MLLNSFGVTGAGSAFKFGAAVGEQQSAQASAAQSTGAAEILQARAAASSSPQTGAAGMSNGNSSPASGLFNADPQAAAFPSFNFPGSFGTAASTGTLPGWGASTGLFSGGAVPAFGQPFPALQQAAEAPSAALFGPSAPSGQAAGPLQSALAAQLTGSFGAAGAFGQGGFASPAAASQPATDFPPRGTSMIGAASSPQAASGSVFSRLSFAEVAASSSPPKHMLHSPD